MKIIILLLLSAWLTISCASVPQSKEQNKSNSLKKAVATKSIVVKKNKAPIGIKKINATRNIERENARRDRRAAYTEFLSGLNESLPDLKITKVTSSDLSDLHIKIDVLDYNTQYESTTGEQEVSGETMHYISYDTKTSLILKYDIVDSVSNKTVVTKKITSQHSANNTVEDECYSSSILGAYICETFIGPLINGTINLILSPKPSKGDTINKKFKEPESYEKMLYHVGKDIGKSLSEANCVNKEFSECVTHYFKTKSKPETKSKRKT